MKPLKNPKKIALDTFSLVEMTEVFNKSLGLAYQKINGAVQRELKWLKKIGKKEHRWIKSYEEYIGAPINFYCEKLPAQEWPLISIGMTYKTRNNLYLISFDLNSGGVPTKVSRLNQIDNGWVRIYTAHCCERFAQRVLKIDNPTFKQGAEAIMYSDLYGPVRNTNYIGNKEEIEFQFNGGQAFGYRDPKNKITYFRTVYSNDMLKGTRLQFKDEWEISLNELDEIFNSIKNS